MAAALGLPAVAVSASPVIVQPDEPDSADVFIYEFLPLSNFNGGGFGEFLAVSETSTGHDTQSLINFDLTGIPFAASEVDSATLNLHVIDGYAAFGGVFGNPSASAPVETEVRALGGAWDEGAVTWSTAPAPVGNVVATRTIDGIDQWVSFDVTELVRDWLADEVPSNGFLLSQVAEVVDPGTGLKVGAIYDSSAGPNKPYVEITPVPLPGDFDGDGDVDLDDYGEFRLCLSGPWQGPGFVAPSAACLNVFDSDTDADVDVRDFGEFQRRFTGPVAN